MKKLLCLGLLLVASVLKAQLGLTPPSPINICETSTPADGFEVFDLTIRESQMIQPVEDYTYTYHPTSGDALGGNNAFQNPEAFINTSNPQLIFIRVRLNGSSANEITTLEIGVVAQPVPETMPQNLEVNDGNGDGLGIFDLTENEMNMVGSQNPSDFDFNYFTTEADCFANSNPISNPTMFQNFENPQTIYAQMRSANTDCFICLDFQIEADGVLGNTSNTVTDVTLYPNPTSGMLHIVGQHLPQETHITLYTITGKQVLFNTAEMLTNQIVLDVSGLAKGIYFVKIGEGNNEFIKRVIKK